MNSQKIREQFLDELSYSSEGTRKSRLPYCDKFLEFAEGKPANEWNKALVTSFRKKLERERYAPLTIRNVLGIAKRVFDAAKTVHEQEKARLINEVDYKDPSSLTALLGALALPAPSWDLGKRWLPRIPTTPKPTLKLEEARAMIEAASDGRLEPHQAAFLALASIFGLRRGELCGVRQEHLDYDAGTIFVLTLKGGEERLHQLPPQIIPVLRKHDFNQRFSLFDMSRIYWIIEHKAGVNHTDGGGWHEPRRFLDTCLMDRLPLPQVKAFLRWKLSTSSEMPLHYYQPEEVDREVFRVHPLLPFWNSVL